MREGCSSSLVVMAFARELTQTLRWLINKQRTIRAKSYAILQTNVTPNNRESTTHGRRITLLYTHWSTSWCNRRNYEIMAHARTISVALWRCRCTS